MNCTWVKFYKLLFDIFMPIESFFVFLMHLKFERCFISSIKQLLEGCTSIFRFFLPFWLNCSNANMYSINLRGFFHVYLVTGTTCTPFLHTPILFCWKFNAETFIFEVNFRKTNTWWVINKNETNLTKNFNSRYLYFEK